MCYESQGRKISSECLLFYLHFLKDELEWIVWRKVNEFRPGFTTAASTEGDVGGEQCARGEERLLE